MSNQENNQKNNGIKYYSSVHAETGFLNSITLIESEHGSDYYAMKFAARRGNSNKPSSAPHSVRVNGKQAKEVIAQIADRVKAQLVANKKLWDAKRGKEALTILITLNISDTIAKSYMNKHSGKEVNYIDGRCTSIAYVRIGNEVIFQKEVAKDSITEEDSVTDSTATADQVPKEVDTETGELAQEVALNPAAENFQERKAALIGQGYTWNGDKKVWTLK